MFVAGIVPLTLALPAVVLSPANSSAAVQTLPRRRRTQILDFSAAGYTAAETDGAKPAGETHAPAAGRALTFSAHDGKLWADGKEFHVKGINCAPPLPLVESYPWCCR